MRTAIAKSARIGAVYERSEGSQQQPDDEAERNQITTFIKKKLSRRAEANAGAPRSHDDITWGTLQQVAAARADLQALLNCPQAQRKDTLLWRVAQMVRQQIAAGAADVVLLAAVEQFCATVWRKPIIADFVKRRLFTAELFSAWKTLDLLRYGRTSHDVTEGFVRAVGNVGHVPIEARDVFWQRFRPVTVGPQAVRPSGVVILMVPGLAETGRHFLDQIYACSRLGHDVVVMDPQWAGQTRSVDGKPTPGEFDRGFGVARDIGKVAEYVHRHINHGQGGAPLVLLGQGCGATGILMMQVLQAAHMLKLEVPVTCDAVLQAPYLSPRPNYANRLLSLLARVPGGSHLSAWSFLPSLTADAAGSRKFAAARQREQVQVRIGALRRLLPDLDTTWALLKQGARPSGRVMVLHSADDPWADPQASFALQSADAMGTHAWVRIISGAYHALSHEGAACQEALWGLQKLTRSHTSHAKN